MTEKSEAPDLVIEFVKSMERKTGKKFTSIRCDGAKEYQKLSTFCQETGIELHNTNPYAHNQNATIERNIRTIQNMASAMLQDANLPHRYWGYAVCQAAYIKNRAPMKILEYRTPYELTLGTKPDLQYLRRFGSRCFVHIPQEKQVKLGPRSNEGIFLGNTENGYIVKINSTGKITYSRDVIFDETYEPAQTINSESFFDSGSEAEDEELSDNNSTYDLSSNSGSDDSENYQEHEQQQPSPQPAANQKSPQVPSRQQPARASKSKTNQQINLDRRKAWINSIAETLAGPKTHPSTWIEPTTIQEALTYTEWTQSLLDELYSIKMANTFEYVDKTPNGRKPLGSKLVFKLKTNELGEIVRAKSRLVAKGYRQIQGTDYDETSSPVAGSNTLRILLALAALTKASVTQYDVKTAYLHGIIDSEIYIEVPTELVPLLNHLQFTDSPLDETKPPIFKLNKGLYGLKQAGRIWNKRITSMLKDVGLNQSHYDPCLFYNDPDDGYFFYLLIYVDDIITVTNHPNAATAFEKYMDTSDIELERIGDPSKLIGNEIHRESDGAITMKQSNYISEKLKEFNLTDAKERDTPGFAELPSLDKPNQEKIYQQLTGSLLYASTNTRPDIAYSVGALSRFNHANNEEHVKAARNVFKYLKGTANYGIRYEPQPDKKQIIIECFVDSDYASDTTDRRSTSGYVIKMAGGPVAWGSKKQSICAQSSAEAELIALSTASKMVTWTARLLDEIGIKNVKLPIEIREDNQACIKIAQTELLSNRTKHIDVRYFYVREQIEKKKQALKYVRTDENIADLLTKNVTRDQYLKLRNKLGINNITDHVASGSVGSQSQTAQPIGAP